MMIIFCFQTLFFEGRMPSLSYFKKLWTS